jgi:hypothetical protein
MSSEEVLARATEASAKIAELNKERSELLAAAEAHEGEARKARLRAGECKKQSAEWSAALTTLNVQRSVASAEESARKAQHSAEETLQRLADKEKRLDEMLAKAKEETPKE